MPLIVFAALAAFDLLPREGSVTVFGSAAIWRGWCATLGSALTVQAAVVVFETLLRTSIVGLEGTCLIVRRWGWRRSVALGDVRSVRRGPSTYFTDSTLEIELATRRWTVKGLDPAAVDELLRRLDATGR